MSYPEKEAKKAPEQCDDAELEKVTGGKEQGMKEGEQSGLEIVIQSDLGDPMKREGVFPGTSGFP